MNGQQIQFSMETTYSFREGYNACKNGLIECPFIYPTHVKDFYMGYEYCEKEVKNEI